MVGVWEARRQRKTLIKKGEQSRDLSGEHENHTSVPFAVWPLIHAVLFSAEMFVRVFQPFFLLSNNINKQDTHYMYFCVFL